MEDNYYEINNNMNYDSVDSDVPIYKLADIIRIYIYSVLCVPRRSDILTLFHLS